MNQKGQIQVLIVVLVVGLLALGGYLVYQNQAKPTPSPQPTTQPSPTPSDTNPAPSGDAETTNWKTYTNIDYNYEVRYSSSWKVEIPSNTSGIGKATIFVSLVSDNQFKFDAGCCFPYAVGINVYENSKNKSINQVGSEISNNFTYTEESINGIKAFRTTSLPSQFGSESVFLKADNKDYVSFTLAPFSNDKPFPNQASQHKIFNQILSTFKFLP